jgi:hypothetical protein
MIFFPHFCGRMFSAVAGSFPRARYLPPRALRIETAGGYHCTSKSEDFGLAGTPSQSPKPSNMNRLEGVRKTGFDNDCLVGRDTRDTRPGKV